MLFTNYISKFAFRVCGKSSIQFLFILGGGNPTESAKHANQNSSLSTFLIAVIGITIAVVLVVVLGIIGYLAYLRKRTITKRKGIVCAICTSLQFWSLLFKLCLLN